MQVYKDKHEVQTWCKVNLSPLENNTTVLCIEFSSSSLFDEISAVDTYEKYTKYEIIFSLYIILESSIKFKFVIYNFLQGLE